MKVKFTQFFDVSSSSDSFSVFTVKAGGDYVKQRCAPLFALYKYYKLGPVKVKLVPASTLPVDPTGLSYETGESTVDPRDMFNPGLVRITNGEPVSAVGDMNNYYATLLDPRWYKFQMQKGFSRYAVPLVYNIGEISQDSSPFFGVVQDFAVTKDGNNMTYTSRFNIDSVKVGGSTADTPAYIQSWNSDPVTYNDLIFSRSPIQTGRIKLGWLPTDAHATDYSSEDSSTRIGTLSRVPEVDLMTFVLPKAFKTLFYYRVFVEETIYFKEMVAINPILDANNYPVLPIDRFVGSHVVDSQSDGTTGMAPNYGFNNESDN